MRCLQNLQGATPEMIRAELRRTIEQLLTRLNRETDPLAEMQQLRDSLVTIPLPVDEIIVVSKRLRNAQRYLVSQEIGAARYELKTLAGALHCEPGVERLPPPQPFTGVRSLGQEYLPNHAETEQPEAHQVDKFPDSC